MTLLKELTQKIAETSDDGSIHKLQQRIENQIEVVQNLVESVETEFNKSQFEDMLKEAGVDMSYFEDANKAFDAFYDAFNEFKKYTTMNF